MSVRPWLSFKKYVCSPVNIVRLIGESDQAPNRVRSFGMAD